MINREFIHLFRERERSEEFLNYEKMSTHLHATLFEGLLQEKRLQNWIQFLSNIFHQNRRTKLYLQRTQLLRDVFQGSSIDFSGCGFCLIEGRDSGLKVKHGMRDRGWRKNPSGLRDWAKTWVGMTMIEEPCWGPSYLRWLLWSI